MADTNPGSPEGASYDERLFSGGLRTRLHLARFHWLARQTRGLSGRVIELGCFNARSLDWLSFRPEAYTGLDADWEGGLSEARARHPEHTFVTSTSPDDVQGRFDLAIAMETLEHLPRDVLPAYLERLARVAPLLLATVPVEIGPVFAVKHLAKRALRTAEPYTVAEFVAATLGRSERVAQQEHKGFDYRWLVRLLDRTHVVELVEGLPLAVLPPSLGFTVGIRARAR